jgi:hypothetical protein
VYANLPVGPTDVELVQETVTLVTSALAVPLPLATVQVCAGLDGCVITVTL